MLLDRNQWGIVYLFPVSLSGASGMLRAALQVQRERATAFDCFSDFPASSM